MTRLLFAAQRIAAREFVWGAARVIVSAHAPLPLAPTPRDTVLDSILGLILGHVLRTVLVPVLRPILRPVLRPAKGPVLSPPKGLRGRGCPCPESSNIEWVCKVLHFIIFLQNHHPTLHSSLFCRDRFNDTSRNPCPEVCSI